MRFDMSVEFSGDDIVAAVNDAIAKGMASVVGPLMMEAEEIRGASMEIVPVDQGDLRASAMEVGIEPSVTPGKTTVTFGYGGPGIGYAVVQHETPPDVFSHAPGRSWKYLEQPALAAAVTMGPRLARRIGSRFEAAAGGAASGGDAPGAVFGEGGE